MRAKNRESRGMTRSKDQNHEREPLAMGKLNKSAVHNELASRTASSMSENGMHNEPASCTESGMSEARMAISGTTRQDDHDDENVPECSTEEIMTVSTPTYHQNKPNKIFSVLWDVFHMFPAPHISCKHLTMPPGRAHRIALGNKVTGTLFGYRKCHVRFSVQQDPKSHPLLLLELATPTNTLVKDMASGLVRIALECERTQNRGKLFSEPMWTMYSNGRKTGYAKRRACSDTDLHVLGLVQAISMGAGVLPMQDEDPDGELMYMRATFERVVGCKDSEAFYMMNPDGTGGPELSIFLLRI